MNLYCLPIICWEYYAHSPYFVFVYYTYLMCIMYLCMFDVSHDVKNKELELELDLFYADALMADIVTQKVFWTRDLGSSVQIPLFKVVPQKLPMRS